MPIQSKLPAELIFQIISYASPLDVVRWRTVTLFSESAECRVALTYSVSLLSGQVSKGFRTITHDPALWKALYANARFLRPPGPFPTESFERAFVQSARLAQKWTTQSLRAVSRVSVPFDGYTAEYPDLVCGRWFLVCQKRRQFVLYDTDPGAERGAPQVLWKHEEGITGWDMCLATSEEGHWVVYVLAAMSYRPRWYVCHVMIRGHFF